jgi:hypothetical protein
MTCGASVIVEVVFFLRKLRVVSNSFFNSLLFYFCSKILTSFVVGAHIASGYTQITLVNLTYSTFSLSTYSLLKA